VRPSKCYFRSNNEQRAVSGAVATKLEYVLTQAREQSRLEITWETFNLGMKGSWDLEARFTEVRRDL